MEGLKQFGKREISEDELATNLERGNFDKSVNMLMGTYIFKGMCNTLGTEKLAQQAQGMGDKLWASYELERKGLLEAPKQEMNAPQKQGPEKGSEEPQVKAPQV